MNLTIRRLDPIEDFELFDIAYSWLVGSPSWRRQTEAIFGPTNRAQFFEAISAPERISIGVFLDNELAAMVGFTLRARNVYEVHLDAAATTPAWVVIEAGCAIRDQIFGRHGAEVVFAWVPRRNRAVAAILKAIGFQADHVTMLHGTCRGRLIEWRQFTIRTSDVRQQETNTDTEHHANAEPGVQQYEHVRLDDAA